MSNRVMTALLTIALLGAVPVAAESGRSLGRAASGNISVGEIAPNDPASSRLGPPIYNKVIDLLDEEIFLVQDGDTQEWVSVPIDTAQFNRLILKVVSEVENGFISCGPEWRFTADDAYVPGNTSTFLIGDDAQLRLFPTGLTPVAVVGLRARIRCELVGAPDFGGGEGEPPPPAVGSVSDVKVLLRRE